MKITAKEVVPVTKMATVKVTNGDAQSWWEPFLSDELYGLKIMKVTTKEVVPATKTVPEKVTNGDAQSWWEPFCPTFKDYDKND